jgi:signal transduction histidine kinase
LFDKLKRKFVIINMSLLTLVFAAIFSVIYIVTAVAADRQTEMALTQLMFSPSLSYAGDPRTATSIVAELNEKGAVVKTSSFVNISNDVVGEAIKQALQAEASSDNIKIKDTYYAFLKQSSAQGTKIVFVDRTAQRQTLMDLLLNFLLVGGGSLIILLLVSIYFANRSIDPIKEMFEKQKQFIADASHELRTPLTVIKTNLALITANSTETVKSQAKWLDYISSQSDRMSELAEDMLALSVLDNMKIKPIFNRFNLSKTLSSTILSFEAIFFENNITIHTQIQADVFINGDEEGIKKVINILIDNAVKNTPENGEITASLAVEKNKIKITVKNSGRGIPAEHLEKIFERFYRADTSRARESGGYGLGLAIAKSIVEKHQGNIYARSNPGADTTFIVELKA